MKKKMFKQYTREKMMQAYNAVKKKKMPVDRAAKLYGVPAQTLREIYFFSVTETLKNLLINVLFILYCTFFILT